MTDEEIQKLFRYTHRRITELSARVLALQTLLQQAGVFSGDDVEQRSGEMRKLIDLRMEEKLAESLEKQCQEEMRQILEGYRGPKQ